VPLVATDDGRVEPSGDLSYYLQQGRDSVLLGLDGLGEYDSRRPLTPSGTNILGLVKHLAGVEALYFGECVGQPFPVALPWVADGSIWDGADMWATADESRESIVGLYREVWTHSDAAIGTMALEAPASVGWWPIERRATTLGHLLVRVVAETAQHAGHIDILREGIDGRTAGGDDIDPDHIARIQRAADHFDH
jgi:hypothetical protein